MRRLLLAVLVFVVVLQGCSKKQVNKEEDGQMNSLFIAAEQGDLQAVKQLIDTGVDVNAQDDKGRTALMIATYARNVDVAKALIEAGADVNLQDDMKNSPFLYAGAEGYMEILKLTIAAGADPTVVNRYGGTALIPAAERGHVETVKLLLEETTVDVNHVNNLGWTALMEAVILNDGNEKQQEIITILIEHGADVTIPDSDGVTPLQHAKAKGFVEIEKLLLEAGGK